MRTGNGLVRIKCCDCGLIHLMRFTIDNGEVVMEGWRDNRATVNARRKKSIDNVH